MTASDWQGRGLAALLWLMPFHAFLSVWLGSLIGYQTVIQSWKELLILALAALSLPRLGKSFWGSRLNLLIAGYIGLSLFITAVMRPAPLAILFGLKTNLVFLVLFLIARLCQARSLRPQRIILITGALVAGFALLQAWVLPADFLANFGYAEDTILPFRGVDPGTDNFRVLSTLGGPNQLGAFLLIALSVAVAAAVRLKQWSYGLIGLLTLLALIPTYSRSAWLGALAAGAVLLFSSLPRRFYLTAASVLTLLALAASMYLPTALLKYPRLQYYLLHASTGGHEARGSDAERLRALASGWRESMDHPAGKGLGTAGPASHYSAEPIVPENYYLQLAIEVGWLGAILFLGICALLARHLWRLRAQPLAGGLLAALVGISVINLFLHGWADSSTALVWWASAGLAVGDADV